MKTVTHAGPCDGFVGLRLQQQQQPVELPLSSSPEARPCMMACTMVASSIAVTMREQNGSVRTIILKTLDVTATMNTLADGFGRPGT